MNTTACSACCGYEYILFDLDGTLSQSGPGITRSAQYALRAFGIDEPDLKKLEVFVGPPLNVTFQQVYGFPAEQSSEAVRLFQERYDQEGVYETALYPGIQEMLRELRAAGKHLAIASSKPRHLIPVVLDKLGIADEFELISAPGFEQELTGKMESDNKSVMIRQALEQLHLIASAEPPEGEVSALDDAAAPKSCPSDTSAAGVCTAFPGSAGQDLHSRVAMVGDRFYDIRGALSNHVTAIGAAYGYGTREELEQAGADYIADNTEELLTILLGHTPS